MGRMSELAADVENAAMVIANDNYDLRAQLAELRKTNALLTERIVMLERRKLALYKECQTIAAKYYQLAEECGVELGDDD